MSSEKRAYATRGSDVSSSTPAPCFDAVSFDGIDDASALPPRSHSHHDARTVAGADEDVLRPGRAVHEVPRFQRSLLAFDDQQALAGEDEEVLLRVLAVVHAVRLPWAEDADADPDLVEADLVALELRVGIELAREPACVAHVQDEPALADRPQTVSIVLERGLRNHRP